MSEDSSFSDRVLRVLSRIENAECPSCLRQVAQTIVSQPTLKTYLIETNRLDDWPENHEPQDLETVKIICGYCGYVREFALDVLRTNPDASGTDD